MASRTTRELASNHSADRRAARVRAKIERLLADFPWTVHVEDWTGASYRLGRGEAHWSGLDLEVALRTPAAGDRVLASDAAGFLDKVLEGEVDIEGNLYVLSQLGGHTGMWVSVLRALPRLLVDAAFQNPRRAKVNVKSHYDISQEALDVYLDRTYLAYSCGMFENPLDLDRAQALQIGEGRHDDFDSLEKAQWRKFQDAIDFIAPEPGDTVLDVGCGYGGQLVVALESHKFRKYVGWTHSENQVKRSQKLLAPYDATRWEVREGDYRADDAVYDHITSTGMVSHVGPRGLVPYVREVRKRIERGGRYVHHALMRPYSPLPLDFVVGPSFNKRYVWPGFHWFPLGQHIRALEKNGFKILRETNLTEHYAKTTMSWYERMIASRETMQRLLGEPTLRAWRIYLAGGTSGLQNDGVEVHRIYCQAV